jgi:Domain of unknown function (DUF222)
MPAPTPEPGPDEEQSPAGALSPEGDETADAGPALPGRWGGPGWAWVEGSADTGPVPLCDRPGPQPDPPAGDGLPAGLDYAALVEGLAASGALGGDADDDDAEWADFLAAEAEGRLQPADPAAVAAQAVEHMPPGAAQAGWLEVAAGGIDRLDENALIGIVLATRQQQARTVATHLSAVARLCVQTAEADRRIGLRGDGRPARVSRDAVGQIEMALKLTHYQAEELADLAITLTWRLPATGQALARGAIDLDRAKLIVETTSVLSEDQARAVENKILPTAGGLTRPFLRERLARAVINADPQGADRRRERAERQAKVSLYSDQDGTATLAGSKLPAVHAAAAMARITAIARAMKAAGQAGGLDLHRAQVMIGLLLGTLPYIPPAADAPPDQPPPGDDDSGPAGHGDTADGGPGPAAGRGAGRRADGEGPVGDGQPGGPAGKASPGSADNPNPDPAGRARPADPVGRGPGDRFPGGPVGRLSGDGGPADSGPAASGPDGLGLHDSEPRDDLPAARDEDAPPDDGIDDHDDDHDAGLDEDRRWDWAEEDDDVYGTGPVPAWPSLGAISPALVRRPAGAADDGRPVPGLLDALLPWTTLAGLTDRPGTLGRIGPVTGTQARLLAQAAQADPAAQWRVIVTSADGQAIAVARIRPPRAGRARAADRGPGPARDGPAAGTGLVGRVTVTITQDTLTAQRQAREPRAGPGPPGPGTPPGPGPPGGTGPPLSPIAAAALRAAARALDRALAGAAADQAAGGCAHLDESPAYRPPPRLREFVIARDVTCRSPVCRQPAWRADLDHTRPYDQHGKTCRCNLGGGCRRDHQLKQHPRWKLEQDRPGFFTWVTPTGRTYPVGPDTHPV